MVQIILYKNLLTADLIIDAIYEGGNFGNAGDDPISKLLKGAGNQGGILRAAGHGEKLVWVLSQASGTNSSSEETDAHGYFYRRRG